MLILLFLVWIIISNKITLEVAAVGAVISVIVYIFMRNHMRYEPADPKKVLKNLLRGFRYAGILIYETAKANIDVLKIAYSRKIEIQPVLIYFRVDLKSTPAQVVLANSITLTPGTITAEMDEGLYCVHCLDKSMAEGLEESIFIKELRKFEEI